MNKDGPDWRMPVDPAYAGSKLEPLAVPILPFQRQRWLQERAMRKRMSLANEKSARGRTQNHFEAGRPVRASIPPELGERGEIFRHFADRLEDFGAATAIIHENGDRLSYRQLAQRADAFARRLGKQRRLVLIAADNTLPSLAAYLGCLRHRHPIILTESGNHEAVRRIRESFEPDAVYSRNGGRSTLDIDRPRLDLHPDLAVLLSTSGSTGATKLVKLSYRNIDSNAHSIGEYLGIDATHRAATSLPIFYSYGLSVVNSHLAAGASLMLTGASLIEERFWENFKRHECSSFAGVPYSFKLLRQAGFDTMRLPSLRYITQAGGRLPPDEVRHFARLGAEKGWRFFVMYGQTEASPRIAYLPPELAASHPNSIGIPIPGGELTIRDEAGDEIDDFDVPGELQYRGPNVMMGYAVSRTDMRRGQENDILATGDIAFRNTDGIYTIVGRKSRFSKLAGLRISFDDVEARLKEKGYDAVCSGNDEKLAIAAIGESKIEDLRSEAAAMIGVPASFVDAVSLDEFPRLASGKIDYQRIMKLAAAAPENGLSGSSPVRRAFEAAFPGIDVDPASTLQSLGGDSLVEIELGLELEKLFGRVPENWQSLDVAKLEHMLAGHPKVLATPSSWTVANTTTNTLRGFACLTIVVQHAIGGPGQGLQLAAGHPLHLVPYFVNFTGTSLLIFIAGYLTVWPRHRSFSESLALLRARLARIFLPLVMASGAYFATRVAMGLPEPMAFWEIFIFPYMHLWFLQAFMVVLAATAFLSYLFNGNAKRMVFYSGPPALILFALSEGSPPTLFSFSWAFLLLPLYFLGIAAREWNVPAVRESAWPMQAAWFGVLVSIVVVIEAPAVLQFVDGAVAEPRAFKADTLLGLPVAASICLLLLTLRPRLQLFSLIGTAALEIYLYHIFFLSAARRLLAVAVPELPLLVVFICSAAAAVAGSMMLGRLLARNRVTALLFLGRLSGFRR